MTPETQVIQLEYTVTSVPCVSGPANKVEGPPCHRHQATSVLRETTCHKQIYTKQKPTKFSMKVGCKALSSGTPLPPHPSHSPGKKTKNQCSNLMALCPTIQVHSQDSPSGSLKCLHILLHLMHLLHCLQYLFGNLLSLTGRAPQDATSHASPLEAGKWVQPLGIK